MGRIFKTYAKVIERENTRGEKVLYIDMNVNGERQRKSTGLVVKTGRSAAVKQANIEAYRQAQTIADKCNEEIMSRNKGDERSANGNLCLSDWIIKVLEIKREQGLKKGSIINYGALMVRIKNTAFDIPINRIGRSYCQKFIRSLDLTVNGTPMLASTKRGIVIKLHAVLNCAKDEGAINANPLDSVPSAEKPKAKADKPREFLTVDEVKRLINTPCRNDTVKKAFLFSVFTGLRASDIRALTPDNIRTDGDKKSLRLEMQKTGEEVNIPLSDNALKYLPESGKFIGIPGMGTVENILNKWVTDAGINKHITFHCARHTFATMMLSLGADIYTVSKLLGHTDVKTTAIYAKVVDKKREAAVSLADNIF